MMIPRRITIIGLGLIGCSLGMALKRAKGSEVEITGTSRTEETIKIALQRGAIDRPQPKLKEAVSGAELVIIATPISAIPEVFQEIREHLPSGSIVTDTASTKAQVVRWAAEFLPPQVRFVGGHPMAGKERAGPLEAEASLFERKAYCLIPSPAADERAMEACVALSKAVGAFPIVLSAEEHDKIAAGASHILILLSAALISATSAHPSWPLIARIAGNGFRDLSRLASGSPRLHFDICITNKENIIEWLDRYMDELRRYREILAGSSQELLEILERARDKRERWIRFRAEGREL